MNIEEVSAALSGALGCVSVWRYLRSILSGETTPHQFSWLIFTIMNAVILISQFLAGGRGSLVIYAVAFAGNLAILSLSVKYGVRDTSPLDRILFGAAILLIVVWIATQSNAVAIWLSVLIDIIASALLILKIRRYPDSENLLTWCIVTAAYFFSLLTLAGQPVSVLAVRPAWGVISDGAYVIAIAWYRRWPVTAAR